jgi:hypothetical protein
MEFGPPTMRHHQTVWERIKRFIIRKYRRIRSEIYNIKHPFPLPVLQRVTITNISKDRIQPEIVKPPKPSEYKPIIINGRIEGFYHPDRIPYIMDPDSGQEITLSREFFRRDANAKTDTSNPN